MRFISIFTHEPIDRGPTEAEMAAMGKLIEEGMRAGWLLATEGVSFGMAGVRVHRGRDGTIKVTDGPFAEAKEVIGGYALMQAASKEEIVELTREFLTVAGQGTCEIYRLYEPTDELCDAIRDAACSLAQDSGAYGCQVHRAVRRR